MLTSVDDLCQVLEINSKALSPLPEDSKLFQTPNSSPIIDQVFSLPISELLSLLASDQRNILSAVHALEKDQDLVVSKWTIDKSGCFCVRQVSYTKKSTLVSCKVNQTQKCRPLSNVEAFLESRSQMDGLPFSDTFTVESKWQLSAQSESKSRLRVWGLVEFRSRIFGFSGKVEKASMDGLTDYLKNVVIVLQKKVAQAVNSDSTANLQGQQPAKAPSNLSPQKATATNANPNPNQNGLSSSLDSTTDLIRDEKQKVVHQLLLAQEKLKEAERLYENLLRENESQRNSISVLEKRIRELEGTQNRKNALSEELEQLKSQLLSLQQHDSEVTRSLHETQRKYEQLSKQFEEKPKEAEKETVSSSSPSATSEGLSEDASDRNGSSPRPRLLTASRSFNSNISLHLRQQTDALSRRNKELEEQVHSLEFEKKELNHMIGLLIERVGYLERTLRDKDELSKAATKLSSPPPEPLKSDGPSLADELQSVAALVIRDRQQAQQENSTTPRTPRIKYFVDPTRCHVAFDSPIPYCVEPRGERKYRFSALLWGSSRDIYSSDFRVLLCDIMISMFDNRGVLRAILRGQRRELSFSTDGTLARLKVSFEFQPSPSLAITLLETCLHTDPPGIAAPCTRYIQVVGRTDPSVAIPETFDLFPHAVDTSGPVGLFSAHPRGVVIFCSKPGHFPILANVSARLVTMATANSSEHIDMIFSAEKRNLVTMGSAAVIVTLPDRLPVGSYYLYITNRNYKHPVAWGRPLAFDVNESVSPYGVDPLFYEALRCGSMEAMDYICKEGCARVVARQAMRALNETPYQLRSKMGAISAAVLNAQEEQETHRSLPLAIQFRSPEATVSTADELFEFALRLEDKKDYQESVKLILRAANCGHSLAQTQLGFSYEQGRGVAQSDTEAVRWYQKAADAGSALAQANLGVLYEEGRGVSKSIGTAAKWYRKAAERGDMEAQYSLALLLRDGHADDGVPQNLREAVMWLQQAAKQGHKPSLDALKKLQPSSSRNLRDQLK